MLGCFIFHRVSFIFGARHRSPAASILRGGTVGGDRDYRRNSPSPARYLALDAGRTAGDGIHDMSRASLCP